MAVYDTPYYGQRRKALTGESYGPYYGMSLTGGGALPSEGRRALPPEISEKYEATGIPAITEGAETAEQPEFTGVAFADDPQASWGALGYAAGLLPGKYAYPGTPQPKGLTKTALSVAPTVGSKLTGLPAIAFTQVVRNFLNPLLATAFPNLFTFGQTSQINTSDVLGSQDPSQAASIAALAALAEAEATGDVGADASSAPGAAGAAAADAAAAAVGEGMGMW